MAESAYWNRFWRRRISRRALLGAGAVTALGAASAAVLGCNSGGGNGDGNGDGNGSGVDNTPEALLTPVAGGNVTLGRLLNALGIDPHIDLTGLEFDALMYTYMYSWNRFTEEAVYNNLATGFEPPAAPTLLYT